MLCRGHSSALQRFRLCRCRRSSRGSQASRSKGIRGSLRSPLDRKSTRLNSSHTEIYTLSLHDALPISFFSSAAFSALPMPTLEPRFAGFTKQGYPRELAISSRSEEHTSELQSHRDLHSFPTRRSSDLILQLCSVFGFADADARAEVRRLHEARVSEGACDLLYTGLPVVLPLLAGQGDPSDLR